MPCFFIIFYVVPFVLCQILKDRYIQYLVAKHNKNINFPQPKKSLNIFIVSTILILLISGIFISEITVTNSGFTKKDNFFSELQFFSFDYLDTHKPHDSGTSMAFYTENNGLEFDFGIGQYSPAYIKLMSVLDEKTDNKYSLATKW